MLAIALLVVGLAVGLSNRARALFSISVDIKNNQLKTGAISLQVSPTESLLSTSSLLPGQAVENDLSVTNNGTARTNLTLSAKKSAGYSSLFDVMKLEVKRDEVTLYDGLLKDLGNTQIAPNGLGVGETAVFRFRASLPENVTSTLDNTSTTITFNLVGAQT